MKFYKALIEANPSSNRPAIMEKLPLFSEKQRDKIRKALSEVSDKRSFVAIICKLDDDRYRFCGFVENDSFNKQIVKLVVSEIKKREIKKPLIYVSALEAKKIRKDFKHTLAVKNINGKVKPFPKTDDWTVTIYVS